ncbi:aminodeoxychorismate lyase [Methylovorus sp. MM2]|uniref:endolytic transglycosylase MltG n=1 Tax=Methylovorus sp. MM2 TaxID=1848038 RepID=UPI0007E13992|nr:endolytic transglycosylase MltG [Methylovorus sp. MM2]OAM53003.1 aminodeoxychorismate lyase [Methylovorus sp. MM2]
MRLINRLLFLAVFSSILLVVWMIYFATTPISLQTDAEEFDLKAGSSLRSVGQQLADQNVLKEPWSFVLLVRAFGRAGDVKAGNYLIETGITPYDLFVILTNGNTSQSSITFIEGWTFAQMRTALNNNNDVKHMSMAYTDQQILEELGADEAYAEGLFFPDTYYFSRNSSDKDILKRAYQAMQTKLLTAWEGRDKSLPYTSPYQALIMASIVEKETGKASERPLIAGVFLHRLKLGMRLQTDPSVIYGMGDSFDGNIRKKDLLADTPYNTYTRTGLPPTPIAMPGHGAIEAALHPANTNALYFVGRGDGSHVFSATLAEHNRAVVQYQIRPNAKAR